MIEVYEFLKKCGTYYLATLDNNKPRVRPFGTIEIFEGKLYIQTGKTKDVSKQMHKNPLVEICGMIGNEWIRVEALAVLDDRMEPKLHMLDAYPMLKARYKADDDNTEVWYLKKVTATINSFGSSPKIIKF